MPQNYRTLYCRHRRIPESAFEETLLQACLYPHARRLAPVLTYFNPLYFSTDRLTLQQVGRNTHRRQWLEEVQDFRHVAENRSFLRQRLRLRLSIERLQRELARAGIALDAPPPAHS